MNAHVRVLTLFKDRDYCEAEILTGEHAQEKGRVVKDRGKKVKQMYYDDICKERKE